MHKILTLNHFKANKLQVLRAGSLLVQQIVKAEFDRHNDSDLLSDKKIGIVATEKLEFLQNKYCCVISTLCESLDFKKLINKPIYDYNEEKTFILKERKAIESIPVIRVALNEEKNKFLILSDNIKFDFFSYEKTNLKSATLFFQLVSEQGLLKELSNNKINKIEELVDFRPNCLENSFFDTWRYNFINKQFEHLTQMQEYFSDINLIEHYQELLDLELTKNPFKNK